MGFSDAFAVVGVVLIMAAICVALTRRNEPSTTPHEA
jgi:hypothetical protein